MANHSDLLASITANLKQAMDRKVPREQVKLFSFPHYQQHFYHFLDSKI